MHFTNKTIYYFKSKKNHNYYIRRHILMYFINIIFMDFCNFKKNYVGLSNWGIVFIKYNGKS